MAKIRKPAKGKKKSKARRMAARPVAAMAAGAVSISAFVAATLKRVDFRCSCPDCIVGITAAHVDLVFIGSGGDNFPVGSYNLFYRVQGDGAFTITVTGATLSAPIDGTAPEAGVRVITV